MRLAVAQPLFDLGRARPVWAIGDRRSSTRRSGRHEIDNGYAMPANGNALAALNRAEELGEFILRFSDANPHDSIVLRHVQGCAATTNSSRSSQAATGIKPGQPGSCNRTQLVTELKRTSDALNQVCPSSPAASLTSWRRPESLSIRPPLAKSDPLSSLAFTIFLHLATLTAARGTLLRITSHQNEISRSS